MKRLGFLALAAAVLAASVALLFQLRSTDSSGPSDPSDPSEEGPPGAEPRLTAEPEPPNEPETSPPRAAGAAAARPEIGASRALPAPDGTDETTALLAGAIPQRLLSEAARCYRGEPGRYERLRLEHRVQIEGGAARVSDVSVVADELGAPRLTRCIVDRLEELRWDEPEAPDLEERMQTAISILDLEKRAGD